MLTTTTPDLPHWHFPIIDLPRPDDVDGERERLRARAEAAIVTAVAVGLTLGVLALAYWRRRSQAIEPAPAQPSAPVTPTTSSSDPRGSLHEP